MLSVFVFVDALLRRTKLRDVATDVEDLYGITLGTRPTEAIEEVVDRQLPYGSLRDKISTWVGGWNAEPADPVSKSDLRDAIATLIDTEGNGGSDALRPTLENLDAGLSDKLTGYSAVDLTNDCGQILAAIESSVSSA